MNIKGFVVFLLLGWLILILQSTVVSYMSYGVPPPELILVMIVHAGVYRRGVDGIGLALTYGYLMDLFSGRPFGTYLFIYISLFFLAQLLSIRLLLQQRFMQVGLVFLFSLGSSALAAILDRVGAAPAPEAGTVQAELLRAALNAGAVFLLFPGLAWLERRLWARPLSLDYL